MRSTPVKNYILLSFVAVVVFALSEYIQWNGDAYTYRFSFANGNPIGNLRDIIQSQYEHYFLMNGRIWVHVLCQGFCSLWGQTAFAVCNAMVYILFVILFVKIAGMSCEQPKEQLFCILSVLFFSDLSYIPTCQIGYIWTSAIILAFLLQYFQAGQTHSYNMFKNLLLFALSFFAGNGNEAISIGIGASLIVEVLVNYRKVTSVQWMMLVGFAIGGIILCLSPGIINRASGVSVDFFWSAYRFIVYSRMLYVMIIALIILKLRKKINLRKFVRDNSFFFIALVALLVFNFIIGIGFTSRQLFGIELLSGIITCRALMNKNLPNWLMIFCSLMVFFIYLMKFSYLSKSNEDLRVIRKELEGSADLRIFVDFQRYPSFVHPSEQMNFYREYKYNVWTTYEDMIDFAYIDAVNRCDTVFFCDVAVYPTILKKIMKSEDRNFATKCADGAYLVVQDRKNPKRFFLKREYDFFGIKIPKEPYEISFDPQSSQNMDDLNILYWSFDTPFISNGDVTIE